MGRAPLINSGGASSGESDLKEAVKTAVINKRAGGMGLISGRKAFQRPMKEGVGAAQRHPGRLPHEGSDDRVTRRSRSVLYSDRSAIAGSIRAARRAGVEAANSRTTSMSPATAANVPGS